MPSQTTNYSWQKPNVNDPVDADQWGGYLNGNLDAQDTLVKSIQNITTALYGAEATIASAATTDLGSLTTVNASITGTTTITSFGVVAAGTPRSGRFTGVLTLTHNATSLILPGASNITTAANDHFEAISLGGGNWYVYDYTRADGTPVNGGVAFASQAEVTALTSTTKAVTPNSLLGLPVKKGFTSSLSTYTNGALLTFAHGLGVDPLITQFYFYCNTAQNNWVSGNYTQLNPSYYFDGGANGIQTYTDATNVYVRVGAGDITILDKTTGSKFNATPANWRIFVRAYA